MDALRNILLAASSQDPRGLTNAEQQLKSLEIQPGFHSALLVIFSLFLKCKIVFAPFLNRSVLTTFYLFQTQIGQEFMTQRCLNNLRSENVKYCRKKS